MSPTSPLASLPANRSIPDCAVIPVLGYPDVREAVEWLCRAFGFVERLRIGDHRCQLSAGNGALVVAGRPADSASSSRDTVMVRVADADAHSERARAAGARIVAPPATYPYGERQYTAEDFAGHVWTFTQSVADVDPADWGGVLVDPPAAP
jgi:uncharacterized glyoxalase superfamily protein PhnB